ncbi:MAG TPA: HNH endonuclease signature motif containing protein, partial [Anaerolineales bacterium]|nr:HNH endonuclease signature motif containing protein [Anaerolineales bacterium]
GLPEIAVKAFMTEHMVKKKNRLQRAMAVMEGTKMPDSRREPIPDDVKIKVWQRDGGKCVKCGSKEKLEYDHILPLSMGGSNTIRNIQLLCENCNRLKGGNLI